MWEVDPHAWSDRPELREYPLPLLLDYADPQDGDGLRPIGRLDARRLARWISNQATVDDDETRPVQGVPAFGLCRTEGGFDDQPGGLHRLQPEPQPLADQIVGLVATHDWALALTWALEQRLPERIAEYEKRGRRGTDPRHAYQRKLKDAEQLGHAVEPKLRRILATGLERRVGQQLTPDERQVFLQLAARGIRADGLQVCEVCDHVFRPSHKDARRCPRCQKYHAPTLRPKRAGGHHTFILEVDGTPIYCFECKRCGELSTSPHASKRLCPSCEPGAERVRAYRERARQRAA